MPQQDLKHLWPASDRAVSQTIERNRQMHVDLSFQSSVAEEDFRRFKLQLLRQGTGLQTEALRLCFCGVALYRTGGCLQLLGVLASVLLLLVQPSRSLRCAEWLNNARSV